MNASLLKAVFFLITICIGYMTKRVGLFTRDDYRIFSTLVLKITLPCAMITSLSKTTITMSMLTLILLGLAINLVQMFFGHLASLGMRNEDKILYMLNTTSFNIGSFTVPFLQAFIGPAGVATALVFDIGNAIMCTGGSDLIVATLYGKKDSSLLKSFFKRFFSSVSLVATIVMLILNLLHLQLPGPVLDFASYVGSANGFIAMMMLGISIELSIDKEHMKTISRILAARYLAIAIFIAGIWLLLPFDSTTKRVVTACMLAPLSGLIPAFTKKNDADFVTSAMVNSICVILGIVLVNIVLLV